MQKNRQGWKRALVSAGLLAAWAGVGQASFVDEFTGTVLDARWTLEYDAAGGQSAPFVGNGYLNFTNVYANKYALLRTSVSAETNFVLQADVRNQYAVQTWAPAIVMYFDTTNYIAVKLTGYGAAPQNGVFTHLMTNGVLAMAQASEVNAAGLQWRFNTLQMTFTDDQILFAVKRLGTDDDFVALDSLTLDRPAGFVGDGQFILGKGFSSTDYTNPNFNNSYPSSTPGNYIDYIDNAMYLVIIPEPATALLLGLGSLALVIRRLRRRMH